MQLLDRLTEEQARVLPAEELARRMDLEAEAWQHLIDTGRMTSESWADHETFVARRATVNLGDLF